MSRRVLKVTPAATHSFVYDGWNLIAEVLRPVSGVQTTNRYVWGRDLSGSLQGAGGVGGLLAVSRNGTWYFPFYDNNGNVTAYVDEHGTTVALYTYDAFGCTLTATGPLAEVYCHRFSTKYFDAASRLYYYGYRFYSPELMRWPNRDPIEEVGSYNLYAFVDNNLFSYIDWLGLFSHSHCCSTEQLNFIKLAESSAKKGIREAQDILANMDNAFSTALIYQNINFLKPIYAFENSIAPLSDSDALELRSFVYTLLLNTHAMSVMLRDNKYGVECENRCSEYQGDTTHAYVRKNLVLMGIDDDLHFCPSYFEQSDSMRAKLFLHELSHWTDCVNSSDHYASYMDWRTLPWDAAYLQELAVSPQEAIRAVLRMNWKKQKK
jgi:RHS repeat-associated protein